VLDANGLIGALDGSDLHHDEARALFTEWQQQDTSRLISVVNLSEVLVAPAVDSRQQRRAREAIATLGVAGHQPASRSASRRHAFAAATRSACPTPTALPPQSTRGPRWRPSTRKAIRAAEAERIAHAGPS
jgi:predicted nucleic acid-binding protein